MKKNIAGKAEVRRLYVHVDAIELVNPEKRMFRSQSKIFPFTELTAVSRGDALRNKKRPMVTPPPLPPSPLMLEFARKWVETGELKQSMTHIIECKPQDKGTEFLRCDTDVDGGSKHYHGPFFWRQGFWSYQDL